MKKKLNFRIPYLFLKAKRGEKIKEFVTLLQKISIKNNEVFFDIKKQMN